MKRSIAFLALSGLLLASQVGCKKDEAPAAPAGGEPLSAAAEKAAADPNAPQSVKDMQAAGAAAAAAAEKAAAEATGELQPQPTPAPADSPAAVVPDRLPAAPAAGGDLPIEEAKLDKLIEYSEAMTKILEDNATDPAAAAAKLEEYLTSNKDEREALLKDFEGLKEKLTPEQQTALGMKLLTKLGPLMQRMQKLFTEHPELASDPRIQEAMTPFRK
jgi:hypothetical protein